MEAKFKTFLEGVFGYYSDISQSLKIKKAHLCFLFVLEEIQIFSFYFSITTGSQSLCYYTIYMTLLPFTNSSLLCLYIGIALFISIIIINIVSLLAYIKLSFKNRNFLNAIAYIYLYFNKVAYIPLLVLILVPFQAGNDQNIASFFYVISIIFSILLLLYSIALNVLMMERRINSKFTNSAYSCTFENFQNIEAFFSIYSLIISKATSQPVIILLVLFGLSFICFACIGFKRAYANETVEYIVLVLKLNKVIIGAFLLIIYLLKFEPSYISDLFALLNIISSSYLCLHILKYSDKRVVQLLCNIWNNRRFNAEDVIESMLLMNRLIDNREENRASSIWFKGFMMLHMSQCTDPYCPLTNARLSMPDAKTFYSDFDNFLLKYFKSSHKMVSYFFSKHSIK